jgi:arylsulfatase A-like enzyme
MFDKHCVMYEEVVRVPLVVRWPGVTPPGKQCDAFTSHFLDLPATFLEMAEGGIPDGYEGESLLTLLQGGVDDSPYRDRLLSAYHGGQFGLYSQRMLRERDWKYVWNPTDKDELYDLERDPGELTNLVDAPAHAERLGRMRRRLYEEFKALRDPLMKTHWVEHMLLDGVQ